MHRTKRDEMNSEHINYIDNDTSADLPKGYKAWAVEHPNGATLWSFSAPDGDMVVEGIPNTIELMERVWEDVSITEQMKADGQ